jgi:hypothetical protein
VCTHDSPPTRARVFLRHTTHTHSLGLVKSRMYHGRARKWSFSSPWRTFALACFTVEQSHFAWTNEEMACWCSANDVLPGVCVCALLCSSSRVFFALRGTVESWVSKGILHRCCNYDRSSWNKSVLADIISARSYYLTQVVRIFLGN